MIHFCTHKRRDSASWNILREKDGTETARTFNITGETAGGTSAWRKCRTWRAAKGQHSCHESWLVLRIMAGERVVHSVVLPWNWVVISEFWDISDLRFLAQNSEIWAFQKMVHFSDLSSAQISAQILKKRGGTAVWGNTNKDLLDRSSHFTANLRGELAHC